MSNNPLVSIVVITYNSSKYVLETLESAKNQTYQNIELIVTDDCSKDDTVAVCRRWLEKNEGRFVRTKLIASSVNTGIPANCNRGYKEAKGEWIKGIAGDDALYNEAIECYISFIRDNPNCELCHSNMDFYSRTLKKENFQFTHSKFPRSFISRSPSSQKQFKDLMFSAVIAAPTVLIRKELYEKVGGFPLTIRNCEDWPMWLTVTHLNHSFFYIDKSLVKYRCYSESVSGQKAVDCLFSKFYELDKQIFSHYISSYCSTVDYLFFMYFYYMRHVLNLLGLNRVTLFTRVIYFVLRVPLFVYIKIR